MTSQNYHYMTQQPGHQAPSPISPRLSGQFPSRSLGVVTLLIMLGGVLRLFIYASNRSLWSDEFFLTLNITTRSFRELFAPLAYDQGAPIGFLLLQKLATCIFGPHPYALRLVPLLCGIASLFLFAIIARHYLRPGAAPVAVGLVAVAYPLVYYASEIKQYSSDVVLTLLLHLFAIDTMKRSTPVSVSLSWHWAGLFALIGAVVLWFSHPVVFTLAGIGITLGIDAGLKKDWRSLGLLVGAAGVCLLSFSACYLLSLRHLDSNAKLLDFWQDGFLPNPVHPFATMRWIVRTGLHTIVYPVGMPIVSVGMLAALIGGLSLSLRGKPFFFLAAPIALTLLASALHAYPFAERLILFLVPSVILCMAEGLERIWEQTRKSLSVLRSFLLVLLFGFMSLPVGHALTGAALFSDAMKAASLPLTNLLSMVIILCGVLPGRHSVWQVLLRMATIVGLMGVVLTSVVEGTYFSEAMVSEYIMPDWRDVATVLEHYRQPGEAIVVLGWDALPISFYLKNPVPILTSYDFETQLQTGQTRSGYVVVLSEFSSPPPGLEYRSVTLGTSSRKVRIVRYIPDGSPLW
ncbi:MAG: hypothetical protein HC884_11180 [Chloroflexaceae bacterium]|nr:hypothetical protein [Chloroflexaceae bacterium]